MYALFFCIICETHLGNYGFFSRRKNILDDTGGTRLKMSWPWPWWMISGSKNKANPKISSANMVPWFWCHHFLHIPMVWCQFMIQMSQWIRKNHSSVFSYTKTRLRTNKHDDSQSHKYIKLCVNLNIMNCKFIYIYIYRDLWIPPISSAVSPPTPERVPTQPFPPTFGQGGIGTVTIGSIGSYWNDGRTHHIVCRMPWGVCKKAMGGVGCFTCVPNPQKSLWLENS